MPVGDAERNMPGELISMRHEGGRFSFRSLFRSRAEAGVPMEERSAEGWLSARQAREVPRCIPGRPCDL